MASFNGAARPRILLLSGLVTFGCGPVTTLPDDVPDYTTRNGHPRVVVQSSFREIADFPRRTHSRQFVVGPHSTYSCVNARDNDAELVIGDWKENRAVRVVLPQPAGGPVDPKTLYAVQSPHLGVGPGGDCLVHWSIRYNGVNALSRITKGNPEPQQVRIEGPQYSLQADTIPIQSPNGRWYVLHWWGGYYREFELFVYGLDDRLQFSEPAICRGSGRAGGNCLDAIFLTERLLHVVWADIDGFGPPMMKIVSRDLDVVDRKWTAPKELFSFRNGSIGSTPKILLLPDATLHYLWDFQGFYHVPWRYGMIAAGGPIYYQSRNSGVTVQVVADHEYYCAAVSGSSIILAYSKRDESRKIYFRVIEHEAPGPEASIEVPGEAANSLGEAPFLLGSDGDGKAVFIHAGKPATLHHLTIGDRP